MGFDMIERYRKEKGLTQKELADLAGVPLGTLTKIVTGETTNPKLGTIQALARVLDKRLDDFDEAPPVILAPNADNTCVESLKGDDVADAISMFASLPSEALGDLKIILEFLQYKYSKK